MADVQIAVIDPEDTQLALAAPAEAVVNVAVPGIQGPIGTTGSVTIAQAGTAATPGIRFESDTNTGIYSPGADQLAISTGGTGRLFVDASGRVGVGTGSPSYLLTVEDNSTGIQGRFQSSNAAGAAISISSTSTNGRPYRIGSNYISGNGEFAIYDDTASATRLLIDSSGRVGIGTTSPGAKLELRNDVSALTSLDTTAIKLFNNLDGGSGIEFLNAVSGKSKISFGVEGSGGATDDTYLGFSTSANAGALTERLRIDSSGRVGIGTSSPAQKLDVSGVIRGGDVSSTTGSLILEGFYSGSNVLNTFGSQYSSAATVIGYAVRPRNGTTGYTSTAGDLSLPRGAIEVGGGDTVIKVLYAGASTTPIGNVIAMSEAMRIDSSGRVGIGTSSPGVALDVVGGISGNAFNATNTPALFGSSGGAVLYYNGAGVGVVRAYSNAAGAAGALTFNASGSENVRIDSSGRVGIGTSSPTFKLMVVAPAGAQAIFLAGQTGVSNGYEINSTGSALTHTWSTAGGERLRITDAGVLQVADAGNITVGTTTGTKIGTATTQKLGFYNATPVVQPTAVADATDAASAITQLNALLTRMRNLGLIAT